MILNLIQVPQDSREAAVWWSARRRLGLGNAREEHLFQKWLQSSENAVAWEAVERPLDEASSYAAMQEIRTMRGAALTAAAPSAPRGKKIPLRNLGAAAAAGLLLLIVPISLESLSPEHRSAPSSFRSIATGVGEQRDVRLADGSTIRLNTASTVEVAYTLERREVRLLSGQALFQVAKDARRPFVVVAAGQLITARGTAFDVRVREDGDVRVVLVEGKITVEPVSRSGISRVIPALVREELEAGEQLTFSDKAGTKLAASDVSSVTSWTQGQLIFREDRIADAVAEINRYSSDKIVIVNPAIGELRISGVFRAHRQDNFTAALMSFYPVEADAKGSGVIALKWRESDVSGPKSQ